MNDRKRSALLGEVDKAKGLAGESVADGDEESVGPLDGSYRPYWQWRNPRNIAFMIEFVSRTGDSRAFPYSWLTEARYDPSGSITLQYTGQVVTLAGKNLRPIFVGISRQLVFQVTEADDATAMKAEENATVVEKLRFSTSRER